MRLSELLRETQCTRMVLPKEEVDVRGINIDSRLVQEGDMFIAVRGTQTDGHQYIAAAEEKGAVAIVCEKTPEKLSPNVAYITFPNVQSIAGKLATAFYGNPSQKLKLVGVTGTNGKTTIATLLYELFRKMGHRCGLLSTVCNYIDGTPYPSTHTTPDAISLNSRLRICIHGGEFTCIGTGAYRRIGICRRNIHQPHTRPHGLSRDHGELSEGQKEFL